MTDKEIVDNYLRTLEINDKIEDLEDITKLIKAHLNNFSFSSLKVLLKEEISLELNSIYESLVKNRRGGYCFEHNKLMYEVLKTLGFNVKYYLARVVNNTDNIPPQTHRFTLLDFENEKYLIDVGIGFRTPSVPVKLGKDSSRSHLGIDYSVKHFEDGSFGMQLIEKGKAFLATRFDLNPCYEVDFEMANFYSYKHPQAVFVNNLVISLIHDDVIHSLVNDKYIKIYKDRTEEVAIQSSKQLAQIIKDDLKTNFTFEEIELLYNTYINKSA